MNGVVWKVSVLVAGRRCEGETFAESPERAVRNFAARKAKEFGADVSSAVAAALRDNFRRVSPKTGDATRSNERQ